MTRHDHITAKSQVATMMPSSRSRAAAAAAAPVADVTAASLVDAVMPLVLPPTDAASFPTDSSSTPLTTAELRAHLIALYNTTDSIRKYCRSNGIPSKRTTLSTAMAESGLAKRKQADFPFDKSILGMIDEYTKTYSSRKSVNAKMGRMDLREHLISIYTSTDSIRKYCKDHNLTTRRSTMTRAFSESGLAVKKEAKEPMDDAVLQLIDAYLDTLPSMKEKPVAEAAKQPPKIAMKTAKQQSNKSLPSKQQLPPDEVQMEYVRSILRTTPPGKAVEVMKDTTYETAMRDWKDPDSWWMLNPVGGPPVPVSSQDLLKWTVKRPDAGLSETPNYRGIPLAFDDAAKASAQSDRQFLVDGIFVDASKNVKKDLLSKIKDANLKKKLQQEIKDMDLLESVKEDLQHKLDAPFQTTVSVTHEGKTREFDVTVGGLHTTVTAKKSSSNKKRKANDESSASAKQQKTGSSTGTVAV